MDNQIRFLRKKKGLTMKELGQRVGLAESTISQYETGKRQPDNETLLRFAELFECSIDFIITGKTPRSIGNELEYSNGDTGVRILRVPVLGDVAAGIPMMAIENIIDYEEVPAALAAGGELFGLRIKGASMEPRIREGDVVIVRRQDDADTGDTAVVLINGGSATVKRIKKEPGGLSLIPNNPAYDIKYFSNDDISTLPVQIIGKVVELRGKF